MYNTAIKKSAVMEQVDDVIIDTRDVTLREITEVARGKAKVIISGSSEFKRQMEHSRGLLAEAMRKNIPVYGVTTGYGKSCGKRLPFENAAENGENLLLFHGCGTGNPLSGYDTRSAMMCRIISHSKGYSGVSVKLLEQMAAFLNNGITPVVPCEGSVGASGDLTPMSYIASALAGKRDVIYQNKQMPAIKAIEKAGLAPYVFEPKETLAMINGTSVMTGIAVMAVERAYNIMEALIRSTALSVHALMGNMHHFHPAISRAKPYPGQIYIADRISELLQTEASAAELEADDPGTLQDPYSLRCAPQILGVLYDALVWVRNWVEIEANSANDNPLIDPESGDILMGGNFYGGHMAFAMDSLKAALASAADMADRQIMLMVDPNTNRGLPADLVRVKGRGKLSNHGFKAMSITASALTAEALKNTMPAASFSRSTESHNQDKVSMGTIAARDAERICELTERVASIHLLAAVHACEIRGNAGHRAGLTGAIDRIRSIAKPVIKDRPMDSDIGNIARAISNSELF